MLQVQPGDVVARLSYGEDVLFRVVRLFELDGTQCALLRGVSLRLLADAPTSDLVLVQAKERSNLKELLRGALQKAMTAPLLRAGEQPQRSVNVGALPAAQDDDTDPFVRYPGRVLHVEGDQSYVEESREYYRQMQVPAVVVRVPEEKQPDMVLELLREHRPSILVLTGHDGFSVRRKDPSDLHNYRTSRHFVDAVKRARSYQPSLDALVIIAGGCQSNFSALLEAGANFASSPGRIFVHCYDPILVAERVASTSIEAFVDLSDTLTSTITGLDGIGGVQTRGQLRLGLPVVRDERS